VLGQGAEKVAGEGSGWGDCYQAQGMAGRDVLGRGCIVIVGGRAAMIPAALLLLVGGCVPAGGLKPYSICPAPGGAPDDDSVKSCCRHMAYAVPR
jgi:hypothetical protein